MKWFQFFSGTKKEEPSVTFRSYSNTSTENGLRRTDSEFNSQNVSDLSTGSLERSSYPCLLQRPTNLKIFTHQELKVATKNFTRSMMIGEGGFGCVYRGIIKDLEDPEVKLEVAVKQMKRTREQGHKEWSTEVNVLGVVEHPNLVKLLGYCNEDDERGIQRLLVYEFIPNRSVQDHLSNKSRATLSWPARLKIALGAARGLAYLHEGMDYQIIFRDLKTSNILLDKEWNAKLSDFGMARHGPPEGLSHVTTDVMGTDGYAAPDYIQSGRLTSKSDIWSYGVVLYELITGRPPIDRNRPKGEQKMLEWVRHYISDPKKFSLILDPRLDWQHSRRSARQLGAIANKCLVTRPKSRPRMSQIVEMLQKIVDDVEAGPPQPTLVACTPKEDVDSAKRRMKTKDNGFTMNKERKKKRANLRRLFGKTEVDDCWFLWRFKKPKVITKR